MVQYLGSNPLEAEKLSGMGVIEAALYINNSVLPEAEKLKPKQTKTPDPPPVTEGRGGTVENRSEFLSGVKFE